MDDGTLWTIKVLFLIVRIIPISLLRLTRGCYYHAMDFLDRYLQSSKNGIDTANLYTIGLSCIFVSTKTEGSRSNSVTDFEFISGLCIY